MQRIYEIGKETITEEHLEKLIKEILSTLKKEKQTYLVNKFVLENAIEELGELIVD